MAPKKGKTTASAGTEASSDPSQQPAAAVNRRSSRQATIFPNPAPAPPQTPVRNTAQIHVGQYQPPRIAPRPESPDEEDFDFSEADAVPLSVPPSNPSQLPAAAGLASPVKRARATTGNHTQLNRKHDVAVWVEVPGHIQAAHSHKFQRYTHWRGLQAVFKNIP